MLDDLFCWSIHEVNSARHHEGKILEDFSDSSEQTIIWWIYVDSTHSIKIYIIHFERQVPTD